MNAEPQLKAGFALRTQSGHLAAAATVAIMLIWVLALYWRTTASMIAIWERSETFAHGFIIFPLFLYLVWRARDSLAAIDSKPFLPALLGMVVAGAIWLLATQLKLNSVAQFAMIAMIPLAVWTVFGSAMLNVLGFPLFILVFAVPFGEFLVPVLMEWTADMTVVAIRLSGVPVYREGNYFMIPTGKWSVVEACSGLRYMIASLMAGCLFAYLSFRSPLRRAAFIAASLVVPILANWIRAYAIVMLGHLSGNRLAIGADHLLYGWVFFGIVMSILFWIGVRWREDEGAPAIAGAAPKAAAATPLGRKQFAGSVLAVVAMTAFWPIVESRHEQGTAPAVRGGLGPIAGHAGWKAVPEMLSDWRPDLAGASSEYSQTFAKDGEVVGLYIAFFDDASGDTKAITSTNQLVRTTNKRWTQVASGLASFDRGGNELAVRTGVIVRSPERLAVWHWYWIDGHVTASDFVAKLYEAYALLAGHGKPAAWVIAFTPTERGADQVRVTLQAFASAMHGPIEAALREASDPR